MRTFCLFLSLRPIHSNTYADLIFGKKVVFRISDSRHPVFKMHPQHSGDAQAGQLARLNADHKMDSL